MIELIGLKKSFDRNQVLDGLDLTIETGETLVIIGRSGCGKSVLLKHIIGLLKPDEGKVSIDGRDLDTLKEEELNRLRIKIGMVFQGSALFDSLKVGENVAFSLAEHRRLPASEVRSIVAEKLRMVGLTGIESQMPAELSGGMRKRVALARAIANDPDIILYDEPTTGLDPIMADAINELIARLNRQLRVTSVVVTHDMTSAYKVASRIAMLYEGNIVGLGTVDQIRNSGDPVVRQFITGSSEGPIPSVG